jgi:hypothetical protein
MMGFAPAQTTLHAVLLRHAAHSRSKNGAVSLAYVAGIHRVRATQNQDVDARQKAGA